LHLVKRNPLKFVNLPLLHKIARTMAFSPEDTDKLSKNDIKKEYAKLQEKFIELQAKS
jgi:hypothetical protein